MSKFIDLSGSRFGRWTVRSFDRRADGRSFWECECDCGEVAVLRADSLRGGGSLQCVRCAAGERSRTHGMKDSPEWTAWQSMRARCSNPNAAGYADYGGRGITVAPVWETFEQFYADMGPRPERHSLDRIDVEGNYAPGNCRWATQKTQCRNKRKTVALTARGKTQSLQDWADETGMLPVTLYKRYLAGWGHEDAIFAPIVPRVESGRRSGEVRRQKMLSRSGPA
jgi:hypothetical protein